MRMLQGVAVCLFLTLTASATQAEDGDYCVRVYPVADLVVQPGVGSAHAASATTVEASESSPFGSVVRSHGPNAQQQAFANLSDLSLILQNVASPASWEMAGGEGRVTVHANTLSLIVRQTEGAHQQISDLLTDLRRVSDVQIELTIEFFEPKSDLDEAGQATLQSLFAWRGSLISKKDHNWRADLENVAGNALTHRLTLSNGWASNADLFTYTAVSSADRREIRVHVECQMGEEPYETVSVFSRIPDGGSALAPMLLGDQTLLAVVSGRIRVPEEEEELLGVARPPQVPVARRAVSTAASEVACCVVQGAVAAGFPELDGRLRVWRGIPMLTQPHEAAPAQAAGHVEIAQLHHTAEIQVADWNDIVLVRGERREKRLAREKEAEAKPDQVEKAAAAPAEPPPPPEAHPSDVVEEQLPAERAQLERERMQRELDAQRVAAAQRRMAMEREMAMQRREAELRAMAHREPHPAPEWEQAQRHLIEAAEHLQAAGLEDLAHEIRANGNRMLATRLHDRLGEIDREMDRLRHEAGAIRERLEHMTMHDSAARMHWPEYRR